MFWSRYVALCDKIGKAPNVVAAEVGVKSSGTVTGWKNGAKPRDGVLQKLSAYFGVSVEDLTGEQKNPDPQTGAGTMPPKEYSDLNAANRAIVDRLIADLAKSQSENPPSGDSRA